MIAIQNKELLDRLAHFKNLFLLNPVIVATGQLIPADNSRGIFCDPHIVRLMAKEFVRLIDFSTIDVIAGLDLQGVPLALAIALEIEKPMVIVREKPKRVGRSPIIGDVNFLSPGTRVLLVDDLMSFGGTKEERAKLLEERGVVVVGVAVCTQIRAIPPTKPLVPDYNFTAKEWLKSRNIPLYKLLDYESLAQLQADAGLISQDFLAVLQETANGPYWEDTKNLKRLYKLMKKENVPVQDFVAQFMREHGVVLSS